MRAATRTFVARFFSLLVLSAGVACSGKPQLVAIEVTPRTASIAAGATQAFTATGKYTDGNTLDLTSAVTWASTDTTVATISTASGTKGVATGRRVGSTIIGATLEKITGKSQLTITDAAIASLALTPPSSTIAVGTGVQIAATATMTDGTVQDVSSTATWTSSAAGATVDATGFVQVTAIGTFTITATIGDKSATASVRATNAQLQTISITPATPSVPLGSTLQLTATGNFSDGTTQDLSSIVTWASSASEVASFESGTNGKIDALALGTATITATTLGVTGTTTLTVSEAVLKAIGITPAVPVVAVGASIQLTATGVNTDGSTTDLTNDVVWASVDETIATVSASTPGLITGVANGTATVTATSGAISGTILVSVSAAIVASIDITATTTTLAKGTTTRLSALATLTDGSTQDVSSSVIWTSTDETVASVSNAAATRGVVTAVAAGMANITGRFGEILSTPLTFTITDAVLQFVSVTPATVTQPLGVPQDFHAIATFTDGSTQDVTADTSWTSTPEGVAVFSATRPGHATGVAAGMCEVRATFQGVSGTASFGVTSAVIASIALSPADATIPLGASQPFTATGTYTDGLSADVSALVTWSVGDSTVLSISNAAGSRGLATALAPGMTTITATYSGVTSSAATATVVDAQLSSIAISPPFASLPKGAAQTYTATGTFTDGSHADLTAQVEWAVSDSTVASAGTPGATETITALVAGGSTTITATLNGVVGSSTLVTTAPVLASVAIQPAGVSLANGQSQALSLSGTLTDQTEQDLTSLADWSSDDISVATVTNAGAHGVVTVHANSGTATITATTGDFSASIVVTATPAVLTEIHVLPLNVLLAKGTTRQLTVAGKYSDGSVAPLVEGLTWSAADESVATVSAAGVVTGAGEGSTQVSATIGDFTASSVINVVTPVLTSITVSPPAATIASGTAQQFTAVGLFSDGSSRNLTSQVSWSVGSSSVSISNSNGTTGLASGLSPTGGAVVVSAAFSNVTGTALLTVSSASLVSISLTPGAPVLANGTTVQMSAFGLYSDGSSQDLTAQVVWSVSGAALSFSGTQAGLLQAGAVGTGTVTASFGAVSATAAARVTDATLTSIAISPASATLADGTTTQLSATGTYSDGRQQDISSVVTWSSSAPAAATVSNTAGSRGVVTAVAPGSTTITASLGVVSATSTVSVTSAVLTAISVSPAIATIARGTNRAFSAQGIYSDGTTQDLTSQVTWSSSDGTVASISGAGMATALNGGLVAITASFAGASGTASLAVTMADLVSIAVTPASASTAKGTSVRFAATGTYSDATTQDLTSSVTWSSSDAAVVSVSNASTTQGVAAGLDVGSAVITAAFGGFSGTAQLDVTGATLDAIIISPPAPVLANGTSVQLTATGEYSDGTTQDLTGDVAWSATGSAVSFDPATPGLAQAVAPGRVTATATLDGVVGSLIVTVTSSDLTGIEITPANPSLANGLSVQLTATGTFSDGRTQDISSLVTWTTSDAAVAQVSNAAGSQGLVTGTGLGQVTISVTSGDLTVSTSVTVTAAIIESISVSSSAGALPKGTTATLTATAQLSDGTSQDVTAQASWGSSATGVISLSAAGSNPVVATANGEGASTISATLDGVSGTSSLSVTAAVLASVQISQTSLSLPNGTSQQLSLTGTLTDGSTQDLTSQATWTTSNAAVAKVANGLVRVVSSTGTATITASVSGFSSSTTVTAQSPLMTGVSVLPGNVLIANGTTQQLSVRGTFSDGSTVDVGAQATWSSSDPTVATVSTSGVVTGASTGTASVTATVGTFSGAAVVNVVTPTLKSISVTPATATIAAGTVQQYTAIGLYTDGTSQNLSSQVTWSSSSSSVDISNTAGSNGLASGQSPTGGAITITATMSSVSGTASLTVSSASLSSISLSPAAPVLANGTSLQMSATGLYSDGSSQDLTQQVTWSVTGAAFDFSGTVVGQLDAIDVGTGTVTATFGAVSASVTARATDAVLTALRIFPPSTSLASGTSLQLSAIATYSDGLDQDVTSLVTWSSDTPATAAVSNAAGSRGLLSGGAPGSAIISATLGTTTASANATVTSAVLTGIALTPTVATVAKGTTVAFVATGSYSDGSAQDLSTQATWSSSDSAVAAVSNAAGSQGVVTGLQGGTVLITATFGGTSGSASLTVTSATLQSIAVSPAVFTLAAGTTKRFAATGSYSDGSTQDLSSSVTWSSSDTAVASISNAAFQHGVATGVGAGSATLTATLNGVSGSGLLTVTDATLDLIVIAPDGAVLANGTTLQFTATGAFSDGSSQDLTALVTWSSSGAGLTFSGSTPGLAQGNAPGMVTVTATINGVSATATATVTNAELTGIAITPADASLANGTTLQLTATGTYSDGTSQDITSLVAWSSSDSATASISNASGSRGLVSATLTGTVAISATLSGVTTSTSLTVTSAVLTSISVSPAVASVAKGLTTTFTATGHYSDGTSQDVTASATWTVEDSSALAVDSASNPVVVTGLRESTSALYATIDGTTGSASVTVTPAVLQSMTVSPSTASIAGGTSQQFTATGSYSDGSSADVTSLAVWSSSDEVVATVSNDPGSRGLAKGGAAGSATITATIGAVTASGALDVTTASLVSISLTPSSLALPKGTSQSLTATGSYTDGSTQDLTTQVVWASSNNTVAPVSTAGLVTGLSLGTATISATFGSITGSLSATVFPPVLTSIAVEPPLATIAKGSKQHFLATGIFSDSSIQDVTSSVVWSSSDEAIAVVSNDASSHGQATGLAAGSVKITATSGGISSSADLTVSSASLTTIALSPVAPVLARGTAVQLSATGLYTDGSSQDLTPDVVWSSENAFVAFSDTQPGLLLAQDVGASSVTATLGGVSASTMARVTDATLTSLSISPPSPTLPIGTNAALTARGFYSDGTSQDLTSLVTWDTSDASIIDVSNAAGTKGVITGVATGSATITASFGAQTVSITATASDATLSSISITPPFAAIAHGTTAFFTATGLYSDGSVRDLTGDVVWSSSDSSVLVVSNAGGQQGLATAVAQGSATVTADLGGAFGVALVTVTSATLQSISIEPSLTTIASGTSVQYTAVGVYSDNSTQDLTSSVTWTSSDDAVATISNAALSRGVAHGTAAGSATITATFGAISASAGLDVSSATLASLSISPSAPVLAHGTSLQLSAVGIFSDGSSQDLTTDVSWSVDGTSLAFDATPGLLQALAVGTGTVTAQSGAIVATVQALVTNATLTGLSITPQDPVIAKGTTLGLSATALYSDGSSQDVTSLVTWSSDNTALVTVSNATGSRGIVAGVATGTANITATLNGVSTTTSVSVTGAALASISVTPPFNSLAKGTTTGLSATGLYTDDTSQDLTGLVTWTSNNNAVASVSNATGTQGVVTAVGAGTATITAAYNGFTATATITVTAATLTSIAVSPAVTTIANGTTTQFFATGGYSDGSSQDLTSTVTWSSSNTSVATVSNVNGTKGVATSASAGSTTITAGLNGLSGSAALTVTGATLLQITISPSAQIAVGQTYQLFATGFYSDGTSQDLTKVAQWSSSNSNIATVSSNITQGTGGVVSGKNPGTVTITAKVGTVTGSLSVTVTGSTLSSIQVSPISQTMAVGTTLQARAIASYSDGTTADLTQTVTWSSTNTAAATVSNTTGTKGLITSVAGGTTTITAVFGGKSGKSTITVSAALLQSIAISPVFTTVAAGSTVTYKATGLYNDHSSLDLTGLVTWASSDASVAAISNAASSRGQATAIAAGTTSISASYSGKTARASLTVTNAGIVSLSLTPPSSRIPNGMTTWMTATALFDDGTTLDVTKTATWLSADPSVATVSQLAGSQGYVAALAPGTVSISATYAGVTAAASVTVTSATLSSITITPANGTLPVGFSQQYTATGRFSDNSTMDITKQVTWGTNKATQLSPSNDLSTKGIATGLSAGQTQLQATFKTLTAKTNVRVSTATLSSIAIAAASGYSLSVPVGYATHLVATGTFSDNTTMDVTSNLTWASADGTIAMPAASGGGVVTGVSAGSAVITAAIGAKTQTVTITVKSATVTLSSISVTTTSGAATVAAGSSITVKATGTFSDGSTLLLSDQSAWSSADKSIATVVAGSPATVGGVAAGVTDIAAQAGGIVGKLSVTVQ